MMNIQPLLKMSLKLSKHLLENLINSRQNKTWEAESDTALDSNTAIETREKYLKEEMLAF